MPTPEDTPKTRSRFELIIALLLGLAAVLTAVASYQGALRSGDSLKAFNEGIRSVNDANGYYNEAAQVVSRDQALFLEFAKATQADNSELAAYVKEALMDDNLKAAVDDWQNSDDDILTPLDSPKYEVPQQAEAERLTEKTDQQFAQARALDDQGDQYDLVGVIVASALFFLGIAGVVSSLRIKFFATILGSATLVVSFVMWLAI